MGKQLKTSSDRQIIAFFQEIRSLNRMVMSEFWPQKPPKIAICAHAQCNLTRNSPERLTRCHAVFKLQFFAITTQSPLFLVMRYSNHHCCHLLYFTDS